MKDRIKSYKFWVSLSGAVVVLVRTLGDAFGFLVDETVVNNIIMGFCGVLVAIGLVEKPQNKNLSHKNSESELDKNDAENKG